MSDQAAEQAAALVILEDVIFELAKREVYDLSTRVGEAVTLLKGDKPKPSP